MFVDKFYMDQIHSLRDTLEMISSIRILGFSFNFSKCLNFKMHSLMNAFHLIEILLDSLLFKVLFKMGFDVSILKQKVSFHPKFQPLFTLFIYFHISKFGKFWDVTIDYYLYEL